MILATAAAASLYWWAVVATIFLAPGAIGIDFQAPGTDWMVFHSAIRAMLQGEGSVLGDGDLMTSSINQTYSAWLSSPLPYRPWINPPSFLVLLLPFGGLGFLSSYLLFQIGGAAALAWALRGTARAGDGTVVLAVLLCPAAAVTVALGQSALLVAGLLIGGMRLAPVRPVLGGILLGLLTFKPQFALLGPIALVATQNWRALGAALAGAVGLALASLVLWGPAPWLSWFGQSVGSMLDPGSKWVEYGRMWGDSVYASAMLAGASTTLASLAQAAATVGSAVAVYVLFASPASSKLKLAGLCVATILAAPHSSYYDTILLAVAGCLMVADREPAPDDIWPWIVPLIFWAAPFVTPPALNRIGCLLPILLAVVLWRLATAHRKADIVGAPWRERVGVEPT